MRSKVLLAAMLGASLAVAGTARADVGCGFTVRNVGVSWDGWLNVALTSATGVQRQWWLCNISGSVAINFGNGQTGNVSADSCRGIYTNFLTAFASNKQVGMWFVGINDCSAASLPADGTPARYPANFWL